MKVFIEPIGRLINEFTKLPGVGAKTAQRYAYKVINMKNEEAEAEANLNKEFREKKTQHLSGQKEEGNP